MATTVDTLLVRIEADMSDLKKDLAKLQNQVDKSSAGMGAAFARMGKLFQVGVAAVVVTQAARAGLALTQLASDVEEMQAKSSVVFGAFVDDVRQQLEVFGDEVGRSRFELEGMAASIQDTFVPMGFARGEAAKLSVQLTKLAVDTASFNNAADTEVMAAFQSALVGNHETVRQFGIIITQAELDLELMRMGIEKGTKAATEAEKVQARLNLIMAGTSDAHGDAARTSDSFANKSRALKAELTELGVRIGNELMPFMKELVDLAIDGTKALGDFLEAIGLIDAAPLTLKAAEAELAALNVQFQELQKNAKDANKFQKALEAFRGGERFQPHSKSGYNQTLKSIQDLLIPMQELEAQIAALKKEQEELNDAQTDGTGTTKSANAEVSDYEKTIGKLKEQILKTKLELNGYSKAEIKALENSGLLKTATADLEIASIELSAEYEGLKVLLNELAQAEDTLSEKEDAAAAKKKALADAAKEYAANLQKLKDLVQDTIAPTTKLEEEIAALELHLSGSGPKIDGAREALEKLKDELYMQDPVIQAFSNGIDKIATDLSTTLADAVANGKMDMESLSDAFNQTLRQMLADAIRAQMIRPLIGGIFSAVGGAIPGPLGTFITAIGATKATGGPVNRGVPTLVGERGPELFVPQGSGSIVNAATTRGMSSEPVVVNQTFNVSTGVQQTVRAEIRSLMPQIADSAKAAVADAKRRGGSYGRNFA